MGGTRQVTRFRTVSAQFLNPQRLGPPLFSPPALFSPPREKKNQEVPSCGDTASGLSPLHQHRGELRSWGTGTGPCHPQPGDVTKRAPRAPCRARAGEVTATPRLPRHTAGMCEARRDLGAQGGWRGRAVPVPKDSGGCGGAGSPRALPGARSWLLPLDDVCDGAGEHQEPLRHLQGHWKRKNTSRDQPPAGSHPCGLPKKPREIGQKGGGVAQTPEAPRPP